MRFLFSLYTLLIGTEKNQSRSDCYYVYRLKLTGWVRRWNALEIILLLTELHIQNRDLVLKNLHLICLSTELNKSIKPISCDISFYCPTSTLISMNLDAFWSNSPKHLYHIDEEWNANGYTEKKFPMLAENTLTWICKFNSQLHWHA